MTSDEGELERLDALIAAHRADTPDDREALAGALIDKALVLDRLDRHDEELLLYEEVVRRFGDAEEPVLRATAVRALRNTAITIAQRGDRVAALAAFDATIARYGGDDAARVRDMVVGVLTHRAHTLRDLDRFDEAAAAYGEVLRRLDEVDEPNVVRRAWALANRAGVLAWAERWAEALACSESVLALDAADLELRGPRVRVRRWQIDALLGLDRPADALAASDTWLAAVGDSAAEASIVLCKRAEALEALGRLEDSRALCEEHVARFGDSDDLEVQQWVAVALQQKAAVLSDLGDEEGALAAYEEIVTRFRASTDGYLARSVLAATAGRARALAALGRHEEAVEACDEELRLSTADAAAGDAVEAALRRKATALGELGRFGEAADVARLLRDRCRRTGSDVQAMRSARTEGWALLNADREVEALAVYEDAAATFRDTTDPAVRAQVAALMVDHAEALVGAGRPAEAVRVVDDLIATYGAIDEPDVQERVVYALNLKGGLLLLAGDESGEALVVLRALVERLEGATGDAHTLRGTALVNLGQGLALAERFEESAEVFEQLVAEFADDPDPGSRSRVALALGNLETIAEAMGRDDVAAQARERLVQQFPEDALTALDAAATQGAQSLEPQRRMQRVGALYKKAVLLRDLGRPAEAVAVVDAIEAEYDGDELPPIVELLDVARELRAELTGD